MIKLSEQVRRLEDTIDSLRAENKKLREPQQLPQISYKGKVTERPEEGEEGDLYYVELSDGTTCEVIRYNGELIPFSRVREMYNKSDYTKKLETELKARVKQVEDLQSSYKTLQEENKKLKSKLEQTVDEYDEDYQTFHKIKDDDINYDKRLKKHMREIMKSRLDDMFNKGRW